MNNNISSASNIGALLSMRVGKIMDTDALIMEGDKTVAECKKVVCQYCQSPFDDKTALLKHIDRLHGGAGLL